MNNYEELPWVIPSDIDFSVPPELFYQLDGFVAGFAAQHGAQIVQKLWHGNMKCAYIVATGPAFDRAFVQLDFFTAFSTKGCPALLPHDVLVQDRRALRNFHVPRPEVELIFTAMRRLFKDDWSERHCARIAELHSRITHQDWLPAQYGWMAPMLEDARAGKVEAVTARRGADWAQLRQTAKNNLSLSEKVANMALQTKRIAVRLRDETGQLIVLTGPRDSISSTALETLELVFHRRIWLDGTELAGASIKLKANLALLKRRKGLVFVLAGPDHPRGRALACRLDRMGLVDQVLSPESAEAGGLSALKAPQATFANGPAALEAIVAVQRAKAARAMAYGNTQTSKGYVG
ncbi:hypothetical protein FHS72_003562 [Loktanella ponticola]|uniref:Uncharacterized protein n=1 Tax=Yoonia ponticola TaxID=1524255 RepID=A0A7W9BP17_9RHOB|nr:hypothetical protein [Yoonia ponticola]MBB5723915.1 hypothetical protein [Yoonia ponticola]